MEELVRKTNEIGDATLTEIEGGVYDGPVFTYIVKKGDCLSAIACRFNVNIWKLAQINNIENIDKIREGQILYIPYYYY